MFLIALFVLLEASLLKAAPFVSPIFISIISPMYWNKGYYIFIL